eukprot:CAMPEP_0203860646 /NCGR_PEP_ID=MMETSP0359-20131031/12549_1 /ASSEMBLY_ACC=CAM_ASM_000338 /TAXON_ID=268821 /ORGANISM="Scrippsiella Hangoei, Strain SHTV-5" /LENGTH=131 /DNA_ID=CAMNT_0050777751 /DNA_START=68 /DNA_END=460 /DNA_ORIENTATION=+
MDVLSILISVAALLALARLVLSFLLPACLRLGSGNPLGATKWENRFGAGQRVLIVCGSGGADAELAVMARRSGSSVSTFGGDAGAFAKHHGVYDVVVVDRYLSCLSEGEAEAAFKDLCSLVSAGVQVARLS